MRTINTILIAAIVAATVMTSCKKDPIGGHHGARGYVYTMSNDTAKNSILVYMQDEKGMLTYSSTVNSGGKGLGRGLGSQGALIFDRSKMMLFAVNAGDNTISSFKVSADGSPTLSQTVASGGTTPISLTVSSSLLYVVNAGGNISGFSINASNQLTAIPGSTQPLSRADAGPGEILFQPDGSHLVVTEKTTNRICTFRVNGQGAAEAAVVNPAYSETPFGFTFAGNNQLIITNAYGGGAGQSVITSMSLESNGSTVLGNPVQTQQTSACWVTLNKDQDYAFATNAMSNTISSLHIGAKNTLELVDGAAAKTGMGASEIVLSGNPDFLYNLNGGSHSISGYQVLSMGRLLNLGETTGLPLTAAGLASY